MFSFLPCQVDRWRETSGEPQGVPREWQKHRIENSRPLSHYLENSYPGEQPDPTLDCDLR